MCGIIGVFGRENSLKVDFVSDCNIYNWKELNKKYRFEAENDSELLFNLLQKEGLKALDELDGVYAFAFRSKNKLLIARDIVGVKPVWYNHSDGFCFASEKKELEKLGIININELNPREIIEYDLDKDRLKFIEREFFSIKPEHKEIIEILSRKLELKIKEAISKRIPKRKFGILFSGGIDSTVLALLMKKFKQDFTCYTAALDDPNLKEPQDLTYAKKVAKDLGLKLRVIKIKLSDVEKYLKKIVPLIEDPNVVKVGVALTLYVACEKAMKDGCKVIFSGLGSEEIFAGYQRHKESINVNNECVSGLLKMYERDLYRDDVVTMYNKLELRVPFLDKTLVDYSLKIPGKYKLVYGHEKYILRLVAKNFGLKDEFAMRKKKAAQYGSNFHKAIQKLTNKNKFKRKSEYLKTFYPTHNVKLGALISSGKDSVYAMYTMMKQNYLVECMITLESKNLDSYMFHTPTIELVKLQSEATGIPLVTYTTKGEKEKELDDLKAAIKKAKEKHKIEGIITGALFSNYQRKRIEKIADSLSLKIFNPLWHINQETEMREIVREGFTFIMSKVAADGLNKSWLNKSITNKEIDDLVKLSEKIGMNIAGEGGEFETLVLDGPIFNKKINIKKSRIMEEDENTATLMIEKAELLEK
ncbi:diphthine--ammonia ligase [Candidatus Woesearchaeota archaeon]|nr:diphthine--ammonia ligase [Candidatus Woesearchaeota archaeon]